MQYTTNDSYSNLIQDLYFYSNISGKQARRKPHLQDYYFCNYDRG